MKGRKTILCVLVALGLSLPAVTSNNDSFVVEYQFNAIPLSDGCSSMIEDTMLQEIPGEPLIPYRVARILLPQDTELKDIKVKYSKPTIENGVDIPWGQPPCTFSDTPVKVDRNEKIYNSNQWYPHEIFKVVSTDYFRGFKIVNVILYPLQYKPKSQTVKFFPKLYVYVQVGKGEKNELYRGLRCDKEDVRSMVDNPEVAETYGDVPIPLTTEEYIIITNDTMQSTFQTLANWKATFVNGASVYTVSWVIANYSGTDNQMKIRNFIIDKYTNHGTKYILLGGDVSAVPYRGFYASTGGYTDTDMAADMYYAHLDGTFNSDNDSYWAEPTDGVDYYAEVAVGRAPVDTTTEAQTFVSKVIDYEQMDKPERVCLHQSRVQSGNSPDSRCLAYNCDNYIPGTYTIDYVFEENATVTKTVWRNVWAAGPIVVVHIGHGNTTVYDINYELGGEVAWYTSDVSSLTNTFFPWTTSVACIVGEFEDSASDCLAEYYVKDDCGAIGAIYNDNYGWFSTSNACMYSGEFCQMEVRACWSDGYEKLGDILNRSRYYLASSAQSNSTYRWCFYERNLVGDPETPCLTTRQGLAITNPTEGSDVYGTVSITAAVLGCIDKVEFWIDKNKNGIVDDGDFHCPDTESPFQCEWDTTSYAEDTEYTIYAYGYSSGILEATDQVTVTVNNYFIGITNPEEGEIVSEKVIINTDTRNVDTVEFWIDTTLRCTDTLIPFQCEWDTCIESNGTHTITAKAYYQGQLVDEDQVTCQVLNIPSVVITDPTNGEEVWDIVSIIVDSSCINKVEFYIDGELKYTDHSGPPFEYNWDDTGSYVEGIHTIYAKGFYNGVFKDGDQIIVTLNNHHIDITNPDNRSKVCIGDPVSITTSTTACIDTVKFYLIWVNNDEVYGILLYTDAEAPFEYNWDTTGRPPGWYTIRVDAYSSGELKGVDQILIRLISIC